MKKNIKTILISILLTFFLFLVLKESHTVIESVTFSISIWKDNLFPSLFPFLIISYLLTNYGISYLFSELTKPFITNIFHLPASCGFTLVASILSGFPSNAKFIKEQLDKDEITIEEANYLLSFCHFSSPLFVIGTIGSILLQDAKLGFFILLSHYLGNGIIACLGRPKEKRKKEKSEFRKSFQKTKQKIEASPSFANVLKNAITNALDILFLLLGIVTIFLIITNLVIIKLPIGETSKVILSGFLEMSQGVKAVSLLNTSTLNKALLMLSIISFGGLSVHTQIFSIISEYPLSYLKFLKARILHIIISSGILLLLFSITT